MLKKIGQAITNLFDSDDAIDAPVSAVSHRTRYSIRAALSEVGYRAPGARGPQVLLYSELNRYGKPVWRAA